MGVSHGIFTISTESLLIFSSGEHLDRQVINTWTNFEAPHERRFSSRTNSFETPA
jgi:hypothetical protein